MEEGKKKERERERKKEREEVKQSPPKTEFLLSESHWGIQAF